MIVIKSNPKLSLGINRFMLAPEVLLQFALSQEMTLNADRSYSETVPEHVQRLAPWLQPGMMSTHADVTETLITNPRRKDT